MGDASKYHLRVTAGSSYDVSTHKLLHVNTLKPTTILTPKVKANIQVHIQNYRGLPLSSPKTSPYFSQKPHLHDLYSISFSFSLPPDTPSIPGTDLVFGNDFAESISKSLPPGFSTALRIVKWAIDPGLDGDVYADQPYLYGPLLSSINVLRVDEDAASMGKEGDGSGEATQDEKAPEPAENTAPNVSTEGPEEAPALEEGSSGKGEEVRKAHNVPETGPARMKHFLNEGAKKDWVFEQGFVYKCDFFNPYLDFNEFALKLPGFTLGIMKYWDGQPLRYVLKHKTADGSIDEPLFVIQFTLIPNEEAEEEAQKWAATDNTNQADLKAGTENGENEQQPKRDPPGYTDEGVD